MKTKLLIGLGFILIMTISLGFIMLNNKQKLEKDTPNVEQATQTNSADSVFSKYKTTKTPTTRTNDTLNDAQRQAHLSEINTTIKLALLDKEIKLIDTTSCTTCTSLTGTIALDGKTGWVKFDIPTGKTGLTKYIKELRFDPENTGNYVYTYASDGTNFEVNCVLKKQSNMEKMLGDKGNNNNKYELGTNLTIIK